MIRIKITIFFFLFLSNYIYSQTISGTVIDKTTKEVLIGATIYIDGTTIGTISDFNGFFELELKKKTISSLVISYLGYKTQIFNTNEFTNPKKILLEVNENQLAEIVLHPDLWSRQKKMRIFKAEFLGKTIASKDCKIMNPKDITLIHNSENNTLIAYANKPIIIRNKYLGYKIQYNLVDCETHFRYPSGLRITDKFYYSGTSFFTELKKKAKKKQLINREESYYGSLIHFMKSLSDRKLTENKFTIYHEKFPVSPYKYFNITTDKDLTKVEITTTSLSVLYNMFDQSEIESPKEEKSIIFFIDEYGNHSPPYNLLLGGDFGNKRVSNLLPLNYSIEIE